MGWREDVDAVTAGEPHGPLLNGVSGGVFPCSCGEQFSSGGLTYRHGAPLTPRPEPFTPEWRESIGAPVTRRRT
jgi:hypothetical protein